MSHQRVSMSQVHAAAGADTLCTRSLPGGVAIKGAQSGSGAHPTGQVQGGGVPHRRRGGVQGAVRTGGREGGEPAWAHVVCLCDQGGCCRCGIPSQGHTLCQSS